MSASSAGTHSAVMVIFLFSYPNEQSSIVEILCD